MTLQATRAGFDALGIDPREAASEDEPRMRLPVPKPATRLPPNGRAPNRRPKRDDKATAEAKPGRVRSDSKQAQLIAMLKTAKGASIEEIVEAFGWQPHTVRGAIAGALKKKLGLDVTSEKVERPGPGLPIVHRP